MTKQIGILESLENFFLNKSIPTPKLQLNVLFLLTLFTLFSKLFLSLQMNIGLHNSHIKQVTTSELSVFINIIVNLKKSLFSNLVMIFRTLFL